MTDEAFQRLSSTDPSERVLLLSHCLRPSQTCPGKYTKQGLVCPEGCQESCVVGRLARAARALGYKGVCTAAGGTMAVRFVADNRPRGIVAVACARELEEGVEAVATLCREDMHRPVIVVVPLSRDGCIDTEVDETLALAALAVGCHAPTAR